jgi:enterochelin esterase-like enzyme
MLRLTILLLFAGPAFANGTISDDIRISSDVLGYDLQYRVYLPENYDSKTRLPVLYLTDGPGYISQGRMPTMLDELISKGEIVPIVAVFVDARDPDNPGTNRRNSQFLCNMNYLEFFKTELIPQIEQHHPVSASREDRAIMGLSFGGTNAACFGLYGYDTFSSLGIQSPANHPVPTLLQDYEDSPALPLRIFLSTGQPDDNTRANRRFRSVLQDKGYEMEYIEVREGHNWKNWQPLLDDVLLYFYRKKD